MTHRLDLLSTSRAGDAGYLAAADLADIADELVVDYRLIGGNAVSLLTWVHGVQDATPGRETADADFGADGRVIGDPRLPEALTARGYAPQRSNRFYRTITDARGDLELVIDLLAPSFAGELVNSQRYGNLYVDEVPGLALAIQRPATLVEVRVSLSGGDTLETTLRLPDVVAALILKAYAFRGRYADRDALDIWRLLEAARAAGVTIESWPKSASGRDAASILHRHFGQAGGGGLKGATVNRANQARIRALLASIVPRANST